MYHSEAGCLSFPSFYRGTVKKEASGSRHCHQKLKITSQKALLLLPFRQNLCFFCKFLAGAQSQIRKCSQCSSARWPSAPGPYMSLCTKAVLSVSRPEQWRNAGVKKLHYVEKPRIVSQLFWLMLKSWQLKSITSLPCSPCRPGNWSPWL